MPGFTSFMKQGFREVYKDFAEIRIHPTMRKCATYGFISGVVIGFLVPALDRVVDIWNAVNVATIAAAAALAKGAAA